MAFFSTKGGLETKDKYGRLYVFRLTLKDGTIVHKVGMCNSDRSTDRMMEVLRSFFMKYRYVPQCELRKDKKVVVPYLVETHMHHLLDEWKYTDWEHKFDGYNEMFSEIDENVLLDYLDEFDYRELLEGKSGMKEKDYKAIVEELQANKKKSKTKGKDELSF